MNIRTGYSSESDSFKAGEQVIRTALQNQAPPDIGLVMAFCTNHLDQKEFVAGMTSKLPQGTPVVGGTTIGVINNSLISYNRPSSAALIVPDGPIQSKVAVTEIDADQEFEAGTAIAKQMGCRHKDQFLFLLYNMVKKERRHRTPPEMNSLRSILQGIESINTNNTPVFGAGVIGDYNFSPSTLFSSLGVSANQILGLSFCGDFYFDHAVMHGCTPIDGIYHTITKNDGPIILELDHQPAMNIINDIYGSRDWQREIPVKELTVGVNLGDKYGAYREDNYINRLIAGPMLLEKGIITPEPDWQPGTEIQLMVRDNEQMITSTKKRSEALLRRVIKAGKKPQLGLYIDCAGRTSYFANSLQEEASVVQDIFNEHDIPLFGFYSGLEIAPLFDRSRGLEWTGVLIVLAEH